MGSTKEADINKEMVTGVFISSTVLFLCHSSPVITRWFP